MLALADGTIMEGAAIGAPGTRLGEVVFTTTMTGYQEVLTDPSYAGQIVTFTYPLIGNYGVEDGADESRRRAAEALVCREFHGGPWRGRGGLGPWLEERQITGVEGVDTRSLVQRLRGEGVIPGGVSTELAPQELLDKVHAEPLIGEVDLVSRVGCREVETYGSGPRVALLDLGVKKSIIGYLVQSGLTVVRYPADTSAARILADDPEGIVVSPGPGDPKAAGKALATVGELAIAKPFLGICLGHQLLALALGGDTFKLKFGHRGGNHPVQDLATGKTTITTQNHGYAVSADSLEGTGLCVTHTALHDGTVEGLAHESLPVLSVQFHPEGAPGPLDSLPLFERFRRLVGGGEARG
ncbi:glutamine-hydrolyzing carbamoyl-phosphate synthase small subunit [bacterium]|nr:glutamine-hydrolyzing carbamoyl-phosphate synthase small subunit [bacterium]